jgi:hypothetical protein
MSFLDYSLSGVSSAAVCSLELQRDSKEMENSLDYDRIETVNVY